MLRQLNTPSAIFHWVIILLTITVFGLSSIVAPVVGATGMTEEQKEQFRLRNLYIDTERSVVCFSATTNSTKSGTNTNFDYAGNQILNDAQLKAIQENQPVYEQAAQEVDIPWQMIAVIHLREFGLKRENPSNGQGIYQFVSGNGGPYPTGPVSDAEFLRQTKIAAKFIKDKAGSNYPQNRTLSGDASPEVVKDTFFGYNGRAGVYEQQAKSLGYNPNTQGYEGSPYVMNKADAKRDPAINTKTWGQIKTDFGGLSYPANGDYGAFVVYGSLAGISSSGSCSTTESGPVRDRAIALAQQELELWKTGVLQPGDGYHKYSQGRDENWCADFVSWVFNQAEYPLKPENDGNVPAVTTIMEIGKNGGKFTYHEANGYTPIPGDIVIQKGNGISHTNIVVAVAGTGANMRVTVIGGNQGGNGGSTTSSVTKYTYTGSTDGGTTTGYVSPN